MKESSINNSRWWWIFPGTFALILLIHALLRLTDLDELQFLTNAFDASRGLHPYIDYWDNHGPLNIWLAQPVLSLWTGGHEIIYYLRGLMWSEIIITAILTGWFARRNYANNILAPLIAVTFLLSAPPFIAVAIEIRGDNFANILGILATILLVRALTSQRKWPWLLTGLCLGIIFGFSLKAAIFCTALTVFASAWMITEKKLPRFNSICALALGIVLPIGVITLLLFLNGTLRGFLDCYFGGNVSRPFPGFTSSEITEIFKKSPLWFLWAATTLIFACVQIGRRKASGIEAGFATIVLFYMALFLLVLPTKNIQSLLPIYFPLAILTISPIAHLKNQFPSIKRIKPSLGIVLAFFISALLLRDMNSYCHLKNHGLHKQVNFANAVLARTAHEPMIFDPSGTVFLKPKPGPFHIMVTFIRDMHNEGIINLEIPNLLKQNNIKYLTFEKRVTDLRESDVSFITSGYRPIVQGPDCYLLEAKPGPKTIRTLPSDMQEWLTTRHLTEPLKNPPTTPHWYVDFMKRYQTENPVKLLPHP